jgi:hypothetical protein
MFLQQGDKDSYLVASTEGIHKYHKSLQNKPEAPQESSPQKQHQLVGK